MRIEEIYNIFKQCKGVTTDSRSISGGELFFALKGENFDGNRYALKALDAGAAYAVVNADFDFSGLTDDLDAYAGRLVAVEDTLIALQQLARFHRLAVRPHGKHLTVVGLTGTNGKTTTKELVKAVLSAKYNVTATSGNFNNSIGVPLTLLTIDDATELAVVEMGASHPGDIRELVEIAEPDLGLITNVGKAHLLGFGSFEGVKKTKGELYDFLDAHHGKAFLNVDNEHLKGMIPSTLPSISYGMKFSHTELLPSTRECPFLRLRLEDGRVIETHLVGSYNADNVMAALAVGRHFGIAEEEAVAAVEAFVPSNSRSQLSRTESNTLVIDAYNANPTSMAAALDNFSHIEAARKVLLLGDMLELGAESVAEHRRIAEKALSGDAEKVCFVGEEFHKAMELIRKEKTVPSAEAEVFTDSTALKSYLEEHKVKDAVVLVKGSRGIKMENVLPAL